MKTKIASALATLLELHQVGHIREEGNVKFQHARASLEDALNDPEPEPAPAPNVDLEILNLTLDNLLQRVGQVENAVASTILGLNETTAAVSSNTQAVYAMAAKVEAATPAP